MTPYDQKRREAGRPVWADMALDGLFLLRRVTRTICASEPTQQTASRCASYAAHARAPSLADQRRGGPGGNNVNSTSSVATINLQSPLVATVDAN